MLPPRFPAAGGALFAYDVLINLGDELNYVWAALEPRRRPIKWATVLFNLIYLAQRYMPLLDRVILDQYFMLGAPNARACVITYTLSAWCSILGILLSELILALRIWAVWARKPSIGIILVVLSLGCSVPATVFFAFFPDLVHIISPFERVLHSILASHAILHIRKVAARQYIQTGGDTTSGMMTTGEFSTEYTEMSFALNDFQSRTDAQGGQSQNQNRAEGA
ncbi:hypothetical protein L218DRAFT_1004777 [Marasmius fiardii PR-910]|nr:hypothetical protein L218DRAFT_1004777 [Marasmius fiardii PR-910]